MNSSSQHKRNSTLLIVFLLVVVAGSFVAWHAGKHNSITSSQVVDSSLPDYTTLNAQLETIKRPTKVFNIVIDEMKQTSGPTTISVKLNDSVRVNIRPGGTEEVNAGSDELGLYTESAPEDDTPGGFSFVADKIGTFPYFTVSEPNSSGAQTKSTLGKIVIRD